ncbi:MAG: hypothetical protein WCR46_18295 [Deltaproteobacteria bacterium]|jgi:hypothetical protein
MDATLTAIEMAGTVNECHQLQLDDLLPIPGPKRVRVIVLYSPIDEWNEKEWLYTATLNPSFDFLKDPEEDIYTLSDGKPYYDET